MMKQISFEFGFTDESHLNNYFKNLNKINYSDFKLQNQV